MPRDVTAAAGTFALTVEEIRLLAMRIVDHSEDYLRIDHSVVNWRNVTDADRALFLLKESARTMGMQVDR